MQLIAEEIIVNGSSICRGIAIGKPFFLNNNDLIVCEMQIAADNMQREIARYRHALARSKQDIKRLQKQLEIEAVSEGIVILESQLEMLQDPLLTRDIEKEIRKNKKNAEFVFQQAILKYQERFQAINDPFFSEKFKDLQDLSRRVFSYLHDSCKISLNDLPPDSIVCMRELTASDAASAHYFRVAAFVTENGGMTTHAAIIARAKCIPCITNINLQFLKENANQIMVVDGRAGKLVINPSSQTLLGYVDLKNRLQRRMNALDKIALWPSETFDGYTVRLCANLDMVHEIALIQKWGGDGVGLFRSEYIFLPNKKIPTEEEQFQVYAQIIEKMQHQPIVIRTFDFGGDKACLPQLFYNGRDPFTSRRAMRFLLKEQKLLKAQIRAILRANIHGNLSILFPMISNLSELRAAKNLVHEVHEELKLQYMIRIGCMVELPSTVVLIDHFVKECDFLSIGTNDLAQYALAVDRNDQALGELCEFTDPSIIRFIKLITTEANHASIPVSVCGEIASDPRFTALLLGLGIQELSVAPHHLPLIKNAIRNTSIVDAVQLAEYALCATTGREILELIVHHYKKNVPDDIFYNQK